MKNFLLNLDEFKVFVSKCINLNCTEDNILYRQLIHFASIANELEMVKCLVENGVDINCIAGGNVQSIHYACMMGDRSLELVKYLVENGADVNYPGNYRDNPLHFACSSNSTQLVRYLIDNGAVINCADRNGDYPLHHAVRNGAIEIVEILITNGANVNRCNPLNYYPIHYACDNLKLVNYLVLSGSYIDCTCDHYLWHPIHLACEKGDEALAVVKYLVANGANVNCIDSYGRQPIHFACQMSAIKIVKYLVANGANVNCVMGGGYQPIHVACIKGDDSLELVKYLIEECDVSLDCDIAGMYPIDFAKCDSSGRKLVKYLENKKIFSSFPLD